jgi:hypothetical protein
MFKNPEIPYPFDETFLNQVPLSYRLLTPVNLDEIKHLEGLVNFSESSFHKSTNYQKTHLYKPVSLVHYSKNQSNNNT